jgi:signal transduction histidine kinase
VTEVATHQIVVAPGGRALGIRKRVAITFTGIVLAACTLAAVLLLSDARKQRQAIQERALSTAVALSFGFDQEVAAGKALLKGLSSSPALRAGDTKAFYDQLKATSIPDGSWLILNDLDGQVVNTLRPFGATLPRHRDFPTYPDVLNRVRDRGWNVSGRIPSLLKPGTTVISLSLRINDENGTFSGFINSILSQDRLGTILGDQKIPEGWTKGLYDRRFEPIVIMRGGEVSSVTAMPDALRARFAVVDVSQTVDGFVEGTDERGIPVLLAYRTSGATNWTTVVAVPLALVNTPVTDVLWQMAAPSALLLLAGGLAALLTARHVERPLNVLSHRASKAEREVTQLSGQLLALQEEERQRIARELHDSTAQNLVAANLGLARLEREVQHSPSSRRTFGQIEALLDRALQELRVFTYLLHPPNLADDGLKATLETFIDGFAGRTGLLASVRISERIDDASPEVQRSILRVVQEALANVHRHAGATKVQVSGKAIKGRLVVRVRDNGSGIGMKEPVGLGSGIRLGVGVPGMRARLRQFGGDLKINSGSHGTKLLAFVPMRDAASKRSLAA